VAIATRQRSGKLVARPARKVGVLAGRRALASARDVGRRLVEASVPAAGGAVRDLADRLREQTTGGLAAGVRRVPVQRSIDIAVPVEVAWDEWTRLDFLPEGTHRVEEIERDGDGRLVGHLKGVKVVDDWEAEILDERQDESFAWLSVRASDCAGLVTFHPISRRLTRLELQLDIVPSGVGEAVSLALRLADRRAATDLRIFKARLETISPDDYPPLDDEEADEEEVDE
jgi:uncharacterized membrane protein